MQSICVRPNSHSSRHDGTSPACNTSPNPCFLLSETCLESIIIHHNNMLNAGCKSTSSTMMIDRRRTTCRTSRCNISLQVRTASPVLPFRIDFCRCDFRNGRLWAFLFHSEGKQHPGLCTVSMSLGSFPHAIVISNGVPFLPCKFALIVWVVKTFKAFVWLWYHLASIKRWVSQCKYSILGTHLCAKLERFTTSHRCRDSEHLLLFFFSGYDIEMIFYSVAPRNKKMFTFSQEIVL